jgi:putative ATPase
VHLAEAVVYLSLAPKSNAVYMAYNAAREDAARQLDEPVPLQIRNAPTSLMKDLDYGKGYQYAHDYQEKMTAMQCLPDSLKDRTYYQPGDQGLEPRFAERLSQIRAWKEQQRTGKK